MHKLLKLEPLDPFFRESQNDGMFWWMGDFGKAKFPQVALLLTNDNL